MDEGLEELVVRLLDGRLTPSERAEALERVARSARARRALAVQCQARDLLQLTTGLSAPAGLRVRVANLEAGTARPRRRHLRPPSLRLGMAAMAASVLAALVLVLTTLGPPATNARALELAAASVRPVTAPAPPASNDPALLDRSFAGVTFPRWSGKLGWAAVGARRDVVAGRRASTVFYAHHGHRVAYTVLAGPAVALPSGGERVETAAGPVHLFSLAHGPPNSPDRLRAHGGSFQMATFVRHGRTCVLAGVVHHRSTLVKLAIWRGAGSVTF